MAEEKRKRRARGTRANAPKSSIRPIPAKKAGKRAAGKSSAASAPKRRAGKPVSAHLVRLSATQHSILTGGQDARTTNKAFNLYLKIGARDKALLAKYRRVLGEGAKHFAKVFYDYLFDHPATSQVLHAYQQQGGKIEWLVEKQTKHLHELLLASTDELNAEKMAHIGEIHYRYQIAPVWIMGAYLRYLDHLLGIAHTSARVRAAERAPLEDALTKLVFRDMGLMLEGYWLAANRALAGEHEKVTELQQQITSLLANIPQLIWSVDVVRNEPVYVSPVTRAICNMDVEMPIPCLGWTVPEERERVELAWRRALAGEKVEVETRVQEPGGPMRWFRRMFYPFSNGGRVVRIDGLMEDITETRVMTDRLQALATTDSLTGLPNRTLFQDRLSQAINAAAREPGRQVALMLMDLDHFKEINDTLGHPAGDEVLIKVAQRLVGMLREGDTLTRLGGDEFAILLPPAADMRRTAEHVARKILDCLASPFHFGDNELFVSASIGIALYPEHGEDISTLMSHADVAMYSCKNRDARYSFYERNLDVNVPQRLQLAGELRHAIERQEFELYYQPSVDIKERRLVGAEVLIRWRHPTRGLVGPDEFIPLAERSGLIKPITDWVIETAATQCLKWHNEHNRQARVAVNVSGRVFQDPKFTERVRRIISTVGIQPRCLEIEVTESVLMSDIEHIRRTLHELSELGVSIAIDDFGTGYSSLAYLKQLPLHRLKIDKSFVLDMVRDDNDAIIVRTIIDLAHNLGREVIAEGIENEETWGLLERLGCDGAQGYFIARPLPVTNFEEWLTKTSWALDS